MIIEGREFKSTVWTDRDLVLSEGHQHVDVLAKGPNVHVTLPLTTCGGPTCVKRRLAGRSACAGSLRHNPQRDSAQIGPLRVVV
jgi:hypothetical protein